MDERIDGVLNILATPFLPGGEVDFDSLRRLVNFQLMLGAHGLTILGVLGEAAKMTVEERRAVMETVLETVAGRAAVVVGTSHADAATCIRLSREAFAAGADGVMVAAPPLQPPADAAVLSFYESLASAVDGAIVVQDYPPVNNVTLSPDLLATVAERVPNARHLKLEDPPLMQKIRAICERTDRYRIFGGLGGMFFLEELRAGARGTMTGFAFTEILVAVYTRFKAGDYASAERIFDQYLPLIRFENQPVINLAIRKELLYRRGAMAHAVLRQPFTPMDTGTLNEIGWVLQRVGIADPTQKLNIDTEVQ